ncbi:MAG: hypothetical protein HQL71_05430 [Magnetococcales bacterium]|nr:hypothetical protein [Magnetococcales bacterium]
MELFLDLDRRRVLLSLSAIGATGLISSLLSGCGAKPIVSGLRRSSGDVFINGEAVSADNIKKRSAAVLVAPDATVSTGKSGSAVFVVGKDAFLLRKNSRLTLVPNKKTALTKKIGEELPQISGFKLHSGALMSVFSPGVRKLRTPTAQIGVRGTGVYIEASADKSYICTCYGLVKIDALDGEKNSEIVKTIHHDSPRIIHGLTGIIEKAPMVNHKDAELVLLESLVGRKPPFVGALGMVSESY